MTLILELSNKLKNILSLKSLEKKSEKRIYFFRGIILFLLLIFALLGANFITSHLVFVGMKSVRPHVLFWKTKDRNFNYNDFVVVKGKESDRFTKGLLLTKMIGCKPEDILVSIISNSTGEGMFYCCRGISDLKSYSGDISGCVYLGKTKTYSVQYKVRLYPYNPCEDFLMVEKKNLELKDLNAKKCIVRIPKNKYFLYTPSKDSYDSKYIGLFDESEFLFKLKPII